jgi:hypothetical protein
MRDAFKTWFVLALTLTVVMTAVYVTSQQTLRQSANDPQIQLAEDWADQLSSGTAPTSLVMGKAIDPTHSLAPFGIIYSKDGNIANSSVTAPTTMLQPDGVLGTLDQDQDRELRFTWQPSSGARFATVLKRVTYNDNVYYVLAARNLREVDKREDTIFLLTSCAWVGGLALLYLVTHTPVAVRAIRGTKPKRR